jgi:maltose alpha-D-glucosyltransferase / alpha-amylase
MQNSLWYKDAVLYEVYVRAFKDGNGDGCGDLRGLAEKLDYIQSLGVTCIWLLPIFPSPLKDDGYDISNYYDIHPDYGTLADFQLLLNEVHKRDMRLILDLVLNHTSDQHPWFRAARANSRSVFRDYYVWSDTDKKYADARIIFLDTEKSNWTWDPVAGQYYWHRFFAAQPDLNYNNSRVQQEMLNIISYWLDLGVDGFRADAVPYLFEREETNCENLPETHRFLKKIRRHIEKNYPGRILLCEANQWPDDVRPYFGSGRDEFHMGFHFPIMPRIFMSLKKGSVDDLREILNRTPAIPRECQWCIFLRNHDELTLEMVTEEERHWMWREYAPEPRMRLNLGIRRRLAPLLDNDSRKIELANSLLFTLPGSPIIYYGDEIGMGDNIWLNDRNGVRTPMQWNRERNAGFSEADQWCIYSPLIDEHEYGFDMVNVAIQEANPKSLLNTIRHMLEIRKQNPAMRRGSFRWMDVGTDSVAAYIRRFEGEKIFILNNLSSETQMVSIPRALRGSYLNLLNLEKIELQDRFTVQPFGYSWLCFICKERSRPLA